MRRRSFLKSSAALTAASALGSFSPLAFAGTGSNDPGSVRFLPINSGWRFSPRAVSGFEQPEFNDLDFVTVTVPHTTVALPWHDFDDKDYQFLSSYRRRFRLPASARSKRVFVDFEGAMVASTVWINGHKLDEYRGGYTPFSFELTEYLRQTGDNVLAVSLDSTERADIPPFGGEVDYMTFGGIYREVALRIVPQTYLDNIFVRSIDPLGAAPRIEVDSFLASAANARGLSLEAELLEGSRVVAIATAPVAIDAAPETFAATLPKTPAPVWASSQATRDPNRVTLTLEPKEKLRLWDIDDPHLYTVRVRLLEHGKRIDEDTRRIGVREASFTDKGFSLNGRVIKLRGLDRHQMFPYSGQAMPRRAQRRDADILRREYHCNIVRTSHYPQSRHFLDRCDEIGLLVLEEIPGWQHIGPLAWQDLAVDNVTRMIRRDWNHPSIILWGVRINESRDNHDFYTRTNQAAHALDPSRQTGGIRNFAGSELLEDVFTINDFGFPLRAPNHPLYLNTEFVGHTYPTRMTDDDERQREHTLRHARIHDQIASNAQYAGGIGWCAFDYNTHSSFGAGDRICYHGVFDIFREPKPAAGFYKSQVDPKTEIVLEPAFHWARGDESTIFTEAVFCSNCEMIKVSILDYDKPEAGFQKVAELDPNHKDFPHLQYPPFFFPLSEPGTAHMNVPWGDLKVEGYIGGKLVATRTMSGSGVSRQFHVTADDSELAADGADATRVVFRVTDEFGSRRPLADDPIQLRLEGPATLIGPAVLTLTGGSAAVWVRSTHTSGTVRLTAKHAHFGEKSVVIAVRPVEQESV
ncbi:glycoside hydrolase family 2 protein [Silvibacterium sp.]|uniref:glycoside hydrolase family 2 protein n=1 Tax=Silvibacterium sp. TaxID=1964179 RepID=UPI0039E36172